MNWNEPQIVTATVVSRQEVISPKTKLPEYKLDLNIPVFESKFPTPIYVSKEIGETIAVGEQRHFILNSHGLTNRDADGEKAWMYSWRFAGFSDNAAPAVAEPDETRNAPEPRAFSTDPTRNSIESQKAGDFATQLTIAAVGGHADGDLEAMQALWTDWFHFTLDAIQHRTKPEDTQ